MTSGMVNSSSLPDRPSRRAARGRGVAPWSRWSSVAVTRICLQWLFQHAALPRKRSNYGSLMSATAIYGRAASSAIRSEGTPRDLDDVAWPNRPSEPARHADVPKPPRQPVSSRPSRSHNTSSRFGRYSAEAVDAGDVREVDRRPPGRLTKTGRSRISRANCPRWPGLTGGGSFGPETARFGPASITGLHLNSTGRLPGQRRTTREADLSTQQTGAQAPSRLPRPPRHGRRPQGSRRPPRARPQAPERLSRASRRHPSWIG